MSQTAGLQYKARVTVTGAHKENLEDNFFEYTTTVLSHTFGAAFDGMVSASINLSKMITDFIQKEFGDDYNMQQDFWYLTVSYPNVMFGGDDGNSAGCSLSSPLEVVQSAVQYRHMEIQRFFKLETRNIGKGEFAHYTKNLQENINFYHGLSYDEVTMSHAGFLGTQLDQVIAKMGDDFPKMQKIHKENMENIRKLRALRNS